MRFPQPLIDGVLLRRRQRFLADVRLSNGETVTAHCPNTGAMLGCAEPGSRVWLSDSGNAARQYPLTWEIAEAAGTRVGVNTMRSNRLVEEAIAAGVIGTLQGYRRIRREVRFGVENSRVDLLLEGDGPPCYVEVKNVTAAANGGALFPDAVSARGAKHLRELAVMAESGCRAVLCFCVQRNDVAEVRPADHIDPRYGLALRQAIARGVEVIAWRAEVTPAAITLRTPLPVICPPL